VPNSSVLNLPLFWKPEFNTHIKDQNSTHFRFSSSKQTWVPFTILSKLELEDSSFLLKGYLKGQTYISPFKATFGGLLRVNYEPNDEPNDEQIILNLLNMLRENYRILDLKITLPSAHLIEDSSLRSNKYFLNSKKIKLLQSCVRDINQMIEIQTWTSEKLSKGNRKKLRQCQEEEILTKKIGLDQIAEAYNIIELNRKGLQSQVSISYENLIKSVSQYPEHYKVFGTFKNEVMISSAVTVETFSKNLYVYMWADKPDFRYLSPIVSTAQCLIQFAQDHNFKYLDLGTSSVNGEELPGVKRFKSNLGAIEHEKNTICVTLL
jgi:hypothetical protein